MTGPGGAARAAELRMVDACTIGRPGAEDVTDPETGVVTEGSTPVYAGKCKVQQARTQATNPVSAGHDFTVQGAEVHVPLGTGPVTVNDVVTITAAKYNPALVGKVYRVVEIPGQTIASALRLGVEEVTG